MSITIDGIRVNSLSLLRDDATGAMQLTGNYSLMSSTGMVLAKQSFGGYNDIKLAPSSVTIKLLGEYCASVQADLNATLGLG